MGRRGQVFGLLPSKLCLPFSDSWYVSVRYLHLDGKTHASLHLDDWYVITCNPAFSAHRQLQGWFMIATFDRIRGVA
jgi:hypothetical protein